MTGNILARQWHPRLGTSTDEAIRNLIQIVALHLMLAGLQRGHDGAWIGPAFQCRQIDLADLDGLLVVLSPRLRRARGRDHPLGLADHAALPAPALVRSVMEVLEAPGRLATDAALLGRLGKL